MSGRGLIGYLVTPLTEDGRRLSLGVFEEYIERLLAAADLAGIACLANDFCYLSDAEREQVAEAVCKMVKGRVPVAVCTSGIYTDQAARLSKHAEQCGASSVIVNPQSYLPLSDDDILRHFEQVGKAIRLPVHVYNNPVSTHRDMSLPLIDQILNVTNASSIKEAGSIMQNPKAHRTFWRADRSSCGFSSHGARGLRGRRHRMGCWSCSEPRAGLR